MDIRYLIAFAFVFILIGSVSAFDLQKHLVQLEVDENYPCHIENGDTIVCPALTDQQINDWKIKIDNFQGEEKDKGNLKDKDKKIKLDEKKTLYYGKVNKEIDISKEYREKVNLNNFNKEIRIGFGTNVFNVAGELLENFDVNNITGYIKYRPLNMTWLSGGSFQFYRNQSYFTMSSMNLSVSFWSRNNSATECSSSYPFLVADINDLFKIYCSSNNISYYIKNSTGIMITEITNLTFSNSLWHNIIVTFNQTNIGIYLDGISYYQGFSNGTFPGTVSLYPKVYAHHDMDNILVFPLILNYTNALEIYNNQRYCNNSYTFGLSNSFCLNSNTGIRANDWIGNKSTTITLPIWQSDNINVTTLGYEVNISIQNITNALIFWSNYTLINYSETSNRTFTFYNNDSLYILENYKVNETGMNINSPIWFSLSNSTTRKIASNLSDTINATVIIDSSGINCNAMINVTYISDVGDITSWVDSGAVSICNNLTSQGVTLNINPASGSNEIILEADTTPPIFTTIPANASINSAEYFNSNFDATDDNGIGNYFTNWSGTFSIDSNGILTNTVTLSAGFYEINVSVNDTFGNIASTIYSVTVINVGCNSITSNSYRIVILFSSIVLVMFMSMFVWKRYKDNNLTVGNLIVFFIVVMVSIGLLLGSWQNLGGHCGAIAT